MKAAAAPLVAVWQASWHEWAPTDHFCSPVRANTACDWACELHKNIPEVCDAYDIKLSIPEREEFIGRSI
jgi:hypothetical protein